MIVDVGEGMVTNTVVVELSDELMIVRSLVVEAADCAVTAGLTILLLVVSAMELRR